MKYRLHAQSSIFSAELYSCMAALQIAERDVRIKNFTEPSYFKSSLHAIEKPKMDHPIMSAIQSWIIQLSARRKVIHFPWCPSHVLISGNEKADKKLKRFPLTRLQTAVMKQFLIKTKQIS